MTSPNIIVRRGKALTRSQAEALIERGSRREIHENLSERDRLDILLDSSHDKERRRISGLLASKVSNKEVLEAVHQINPWKAGQPKGKK